MQLNLNIYEAGKVVKTYTANEFDLMFGTVEDIIALVDLDAFGCGATDAALIAAATKIVVKGFDQVKDLLKEVFVGITDAELRKCKTSEVAKALVQIVKYSLTEIAGIGNKGKN
jgi:hypothetical protein